MKKTTLALLCVLALFTLAYFVVLFFRFYEDLELMKMLVPNDAARAAQSLIFSGAILLTPIFCFDQLLKYDEFEYTSSRIEYGFVLTLSFVLLVFEIVLQSSSYFTVLLSQEGANDKVLTHTLEKAAFVGWGLLIPILHYYICYLLVREFSKVGKRV